MVRSDILTEGTECMIECGDGEGVFDFVDGEGEGNIYFIYFS